MTESYRETRLISLMQATANNLLAYLKDCWGNNKPVSIQC